MERTLTFLLEDFETFGDSSIKGALIQKYPDIREGDSLTLEFVETSTNWRIDNDGPLHGIVPEFFPLCFAADLVWLVDRFDVKLRRVTQDPH